MGVLELSLIVGIGWTAVAGMAMALGAVAGKADRRMEALARGGLAAAAQDQAAQRGHAPSDHETGNGGAHQRRGAVAAQL
jgi:hypothetical protein